MPVDQKLIDAAVDQASRRFPGRDGVAAAVRLSDGSVLTGVSLANFNAAMSLCAETGPICAAYTAGQSIVASVCVLREVATGRTKVLAPCGACQERLALWGTEVEVGVFDPDEPAGWSSRRLAELHPFYWAAGLTADHGWPAASEHEW